MPPATLAFVKRFLKEPGQIGAVLPSGRALARAMSASVPEGVSVLEIGAGTGSLTRELLKRPPSRLTAVEMDAHLAKVFGREFPTVDLKIEDAEDALAQDGPWDAIVSGIPFVMMEKAKRDRMFDLITRKLSPNGVFVMFQYSLTTKTELKKIFKEVSIRLVPLNIPPAFVYVCRN